MRVSDIAAAGLRSLHRTPLRSLLAALGIVAGVSLRAILGTLEEEARPIMRYT